MLENNELDLRRNVGDTVQLQFVPGNEEERYYVKLLGFCMGKSIIVSKPRLDGASLHVEKDQQFIVRLISGQTSQGFSADVLHTTKHPYPHMHLTFPNNLQTTTVRKAERVDCTLIVSVKKLDEENNEAESKSATLSNLSTAGAQLTTNEAIAEPGQKLAIQCKVTVANIAQYLNITGIICRKQEKEDADIGKFEYGVEFTITNDAEKVLLHAFIYEQILNI